MARDEQLKRLWDNVVLNLSNQFADGEKLDLDAIIYIIGLQEKGNLKTKYNKEDKINKDKANRAFTDKLIERGKI